MSYLNQTIKILILATGLLAACSSHNAQQSVETPHTADSIYTCPMHPEIRSPHPGQCPICGMDLVPVAAAPSTGPTRMQIDTRSALRAGFHSSAVTLSTFETLVRADGEITFADSRKRTIALRAGGWVRALGAGRPGDTLRSGQTMLMLESPELEAAQRDYIAVLAQNGANSQLARTFAQRLHVLGLSDSQVQTLTETSNIQRQIPITAPYGGLVISRPIQLGQKLDAGATIMEIADLAEVWIEAQIFQDDLPHVLPGMPATIFAPGHGGNLRGTVQRILPQMHAASRTATVRIVVRNSEITLHPGAVVIVHIHRRQTDILTVPRDAVVLSGTTARVFVDHGQGMVEPRLVTLGASNADVYEITDGVKAGERVVDGAVFLISAESRLRYSLPDTVPGEQHGH